jgi:hypothetical protein
MPVYAKEHSFVKLVNEHGLDHNWPKAISEAMNASKHFSITGKRNDAVYRSYCPEGETIDYEAIADTAINFRRLETAGSYKPKKSVTTKPIAKPVTVPVSAYLNEQNANAYGESVIAKPTDIQELKTAVHGSVIDTQYHLPKVSLSYLTPKPRTHYDIDAFAYALIDNRIREVQIVGVRNYEAGGYLHELAYITDRGARFIAPNYSVTDLYDNPSDITDMLINNIKTLMH